MVKQEFKCYYYCVHCEKENNTIFKSNKIDNIIDCAFRCINCESQLEVWDIIKEEDGYRLEVEWISKRIEE